MFLLARHCLQRTNNIDIKNVPIVESRFFGTATNVEDYLKQIRENGYNTTVKQATHHTDFVGRTPLLLGRTKYILGGNEPTGGIEDKWFLYSHSSYYGEVPDKFLRNPDNTPKLDKHGEKRTNPEYEDYVKKWGKPKKDDNGNWINQSLPKEVILDKNDRIKFKGEK